MEQRTYSSAVARKSGLQSIHERPLTSSCAYPSKNFIQFKISTRDQFINNPNSFPHIEKIALVDIRLANGKYFMVRLIGDDKVKNDG